MTAPQLVYPYEPDQSETTLAHESLVRLRATFRPRGKEVAFQINKLPERPTDTPTAHILEAELLLADTGDFMLISWEITPEQSDALHTVFGHTLATVTDPIDLLLAPRPQHGRLKLKLVALANPTTAQAVLLR